jgi:hypothetical protein
MLILRIRALTSADISGLPGPRLLFQAQYRRKPLRCQPITVSGLTITKADRDVWRIVLDAKEEVRAGQHSLERTPMPASKPP